MDIFNTISLGEIWGVIITTVVGCIIKVIFSFLQEQKTKHEQEQKAKDDIIKALMKNNQELLDWRTDMETKNNLFERELQVISEQIKQITESDLIILKDRILQSCRYFISKGSITMAARENIAEMYACYKDMGGNGTGKIMFEEAMKLEISDITHVDHDNNYGHDHLDDGGVKDENHTRKNKAGNHSNI